jgi:hypothetical protein
MSTAGLPREMRQEMERTTWLEFAGVMLMLVGAFNIIDGITAISGSDYLVNNLLFANLDAWGWFFVIVGVIQILAGWAVIKGKNWGAIIGIVTAFGNAIAQLTSSHTFVFWAITILVIDVLIIYGLVKYGGNRGRAAAS